MGSKGRAYNMDEIGDTRSSAKMDAHKLMIQKYIDKGYEMESQEMSDEEGLDHELISITMTTILNSPNYEMPHVKFEAKETFGNYSYEEEVFKPLEFPRFDVATYIKGADLKSFNDPWKRVSFDD